MSMQGTRGQAVVETAVFMPLLLTAVAAMILYSQVGVAQERAQTAVRYGFTSAAQAESIGGIYGQLSTAGGSGSMACPQSVTAGTAAAVTQSQDAGSAPAPSIWTPTSVVPSCTMSFYKTMNGGNVFLSSGFVGSISSSVTAQMKVPQSLAAFERGAVSASMTTLTAASPAIIMFCRPFVAAPVAAALSGDASQPFGGYQSPGGNPHNC